MNWEQTVTIASKIGVFAGWDGERQAAFARQLAVSSIGVVAYDVISATVDRMLEEVEPAKLSLAKLAEMVKTRPIPHRLALPPPEARKSRYVCTQEDRAALASLQRAFANRGKGEAAEFDRMMERMKVRDGVEWVAPFEDEVPF